jgi:saxitoxin biosynthesis operon SxtJ-like protein
MSAANHSTFNPSERMLRQFAAMWIVFFAGAAAWQQFRLHRPTVAAVLAVLAVTVGPIGVAWPRAIRPVFVGWMTLAYPIGWVVSRMVLGVVFYLLFTPVAWIFRLIGRDALELKSRATATTYWHSKQQLTDKSEYLRQF